MSDTANTEQKPTSTTPPAEKTELKPPEHDSTPERIFLVPYPKYIFSYPTYIVAFISMIWMWFAGKSSVGPNDIGAVVTTWIFLGVLAMNSIVIVFDFPRATSLTLFFLIAALLLGGILLFTLQPQLFPAIADVLEKVRPVANATFFTIVTCIMTLTYAAILVAVRFDYWEVSSNELLHHHGFLSDLKRYSAPGLRIDKEVNDVFEFMLLGSGRLILQPAGERRAIILDNVPFITKKEAAITQLLGALKVEVRPEK